MEEPPKKYFRMFPGNEVRLMNAYFVTCTGCEKDADGNVTVVHCTYDPAVQGRQQPGRKKGEGDHSLGGRGPPPSRRSAVSMKISWMRRRAVYNEDGSLNLNPNSLTVLKDCLCGAVSGGREGL